MTFVATVSELANGTVSFLSSVDYSALMVLLMMGLLVALIWNLNRKGNVSFSIDDLLLGGDGKASTSKIALVVALILSSWAFVHLTLNDKLTEWFFVTYMSVWVLNKGLSKYLEIKDYTNKKETTDS